MDKFWVVRDGERVGPFDETEILRSYESGALRADDLLVAEEGGRGARIAEVFDQLRRDILTSPDLTLEDFEPAPSSGPVSVPAPLGPAPDDLPAALPGRPPALPYWVLVGLVAAALAAAAVLIVIFVF